MTGIFWPIFTFSAVFLFLVFLVYRIVKIIRMPAHLRWELAPTPFERAKSRYGGSYLEDYEWWQKPRRRSLSGVVAYMCAEIFTLKSVWKNNRALWPFSFALHIGIYLVIISLIFHLVDALLIITGAAGSVLNVFQDIASVIAIAGYILGTIGVLGLILKRTLDARYRTFSSFSTYFRLVFLGGVFISGIIALAYDSGFAAAIGLFVKKLVTLNSTIALTAPTAAHTINLLLFIVYLPLTDMAHFVLKYFTYHAVRWEDKPLDKNMAVKVQSMASQSVGWSAEHAGAACGKKWGDFTGGENGGQKEP